MEEGLPGCPVCDTRKVRKQPFHYNFAGRELHGYRCPRCSAIFVHPQPSAKEIADLYSADYFEGGDFRCGHENSAFEDGPLAHLVNMGVLNAIQGLKPAGKLLEIGCASGAFLNAARTLGYDVLGVELSVDACREAKEKFGLHVIQGDLMEAKLRDASMDIVYMGDVLEHLPDPVGITREVYRILRPSGLLVVEVPAQTNTLFSRLGFLLYAALNKSTVVALPPYHLFEYRPASVRFLLRRAGFRVQRIDQSCIPPGEINLRGGLLERLGKKVFQYPNWLLTRTLHINGDRLAIYAVRE